MMYYQYLFLYNILSMKFRWVRLSPFSLSSKPCTRFRRLWCRDILGGRKRCRGWVSTEMHLNNLSSALSHRSSKLVKSPGQNPALMLRLMNACNRPLTSALAKQRYSNFVTQFEFLGSIIEFSDSIHEPKLISPISYRISDINYYLVCFYTNIHVPDKWNSHHHTSLVLLWQKN